MNKGFTLIELLIVLTILGLIIVGVKGAINKRSEQENNRIINTEPVHY